MKPIKIAILGLGTVGAGVINILSRNQEEIARRAGRAIEISHVVVRDLTKTRDCNTESMILTTDANSVINNDEVDVIVELIGGEKEAKEYVLQSIKHGKPVVTANKSLLALHGNEIFTAAEQAGLMVAFEAAVAGGIPIIKSLREGLAGNHIHWVAGIINGAANFILSEMAETGCEFDESLAFAQNLGFAAADPTLAIEGIDTAHKLTVLASIAFGIPLQFEKVHVEGISQITPADIAYADELDFTIKLLGITRRSAEGIELRVHPTLVPSSCTLASVNGTNNAVLIQADAVGSTMYYGPGVGAEATASAVCADLVDVTRTLTTDRENRVPHLAFQRDSLHDYPMLPLEAIETAFYLRLHVIDRPGMLAEITTALGNNGISIEAVLQKGYDSTSDYTPIVILTHPVLEENMNEAIRQINSLDGVQQEVVRIRIELLDSPIERL